jgi:primosomal protein N' (replication factor Y)
MPPNETSYTESLWEEYSDIDVADVVVDIDAPDLQPSYSYRIPEKMRNRLAAGMCVHIPFHGRETLGYVLGKRKLSTTDPLAARLKAVIAIVEDAITINDEQLRTVRWMSEQYVCSLVDAVRCVAPATLGSHVQAITRLANPALRGWDLGDSIPQAHVVETLRALNGEAELETLRKTANLPNFHSAYASLLDRGLLVEIRRVTRAKTVKKTVKAYRLGAAADALSGTTSKRSPQQQRILNALVDWSRGEAGPMPADELLRASDVRATSVKGLVDKGLLHVEEVTVWRTPVSASGPRTTPPTLTSGQQRAVDKLRVCLQSGEPRTVLLFGVTASGKTEVYLNAIAETLSLGHSAIVLLPEIALTAQVVDVFVGRFGEQVAVLHSRLSEGERHDEWRRMQEGRARIVVGARSAIFAPVQNVGLIVVDEEHEASYKQDKMPRYNAKDLAAHRAALSNATLLLGSATPSLESYFAATAGDRAVGNRGSGVVDVSVIQNPNAQRAPKIRNSLSPSRSQLIEMPYRIENRPLPEVKLVDLREEFKVRRALFSELLTQAMADRLALKQQTILFLNRRGYAQFVLCRDCGWSAKCPNCAVSLAYHIYERALKCHHCEYTGRPPETCPDCGGLKVKAFGIGTEKVEEEVLNLFPHARIARMDRDTTSKKGAHGRILRDFRQGNADILIGTQMVAKGLDFPNVTLVGVVSADTAINMPDFRAAERTFQLLTQVAGRAGRGTTAGEVIIQTFSPDHYAVQAAIHHDYLAFYNQEILFRKELKYPPFSRFANLISSDVHELKAQARATALAAALERTMPDSIEIIGPSAAPIARLKNQFRYHVALRAPVDAPISALVAEAMALLSTSERLGISIDIDPLNMA